MSGPPAALRAAALRYLTRLLATRHFWASVTDGPGEEELEDAAVTVETLVAVGALSLDEGRDWRARLERPFAERPALDPALHARAVEHVEALVAGGAAEAEIDAAVSAFTGSGLISVAEQREWLERIRPSEPQVRTGAMWASAEPGEPAFDDSVLRRALLGPVDRVAGLRVTVVELYERAVALHWHFADDGTPEARAFSARLGPDHDLEAGDHLDATFELRDDRGTPYHAVSSSWGFSEDGAAGSGFDGLAPGVPDDAAFLEVVVEGLPLRIDLAGGD